MTNVRPDSADGRPTQDAALPGRVRDRFSERGPDYGPEIIDGYEEPPYDEPEDEDSAR